MFHAVVIRPFYIRDATRLLHALALLGSVACKQRSYTHTHTFYSFNRKFILMVNLWLKHFNAINYLRVYREALFCCYVKMVECVHVKC